MTKDAEIKKPPFRRNVRTACITCKIRRVKCDEMKPECLRCQKYCGRCEGYIAPCKTKPQPPAPQAFKRSMIAPKIVKQPSIEGVFGTPEEQRLFRVFLDMTSPALAGAYDSPIWSYLLPQHSRNQPFVRYGLAALGAMTLMFMEVTAQRRAGIRGPRGNCLGSSELYTTAITLYNKSVKQMRVILSSANHSISDALFGCILVVCFEGFLGHHYAFALHAQSGLDLFYRWEDRQTTIDCRNSPFHSPNRMELEDELVATMHRLDLQVMTSFDTRSTATHKALASRGNHALKSMPGVFLSLSETRLFWDIIFSQICHYLASRMSSTGNMSQAMMSHGPTMPYPDILGVPISIRLFAQGTIIPEAEKVEQIKYFAQIEAWDSAYTTVLKTLRVAGNTAARGASILLMHMKMTRILLAGAFFKSEMEYDAMLPEFQSIYSLAVSVWSSHITAYNAGVSYNFELGLLAPLFLVGTRCRDSKLRTQVVNLLFSDFHRENCWDSFGIGHITRWLINVEEEEFLEENGVPKRELREKHLKINDGAGSNHRALVRRTLNTGCGPELNLQEVWALPIVEKGLLSAEVSTIPGLPNTETQTSRSKKAEKVKMRGNQEGVFGQEDKAHIIPEERRVRITRFNIDLNVQKVQLEYTQGCIRKEGNLHY